MLPLAFIIPLLSRRKVTTWFIQIQWFIISPSYPQQPPFVCSFRDHISLMVKSLSYIWQKSFLKSWCVCCVVFVASTPATEKRPRNSLFTQEVMEPLQTAMKCLRLRHRRTILNDRQSPGNFFLNAMSCRLYKNCLTMQSMKIQSGNDQLRSLGILWILFYGD